MLEQKLIQLLDLYPTDSPNAALIRASLINEGLIDPETFQLTSLGLIIVKDILIYASRVL